MKKTLILLSISIISLTSFSQSNTGINLCSIKDSKPYVITLTLEQLIECGELTANNKDLTISSFSIAMLAGDDALEITVKGHKLSEKVITAIKKHKPSKIYIEKIELSSKKGSIQYAGAHTVKLIKK